MATIIYTVCSWVGYHRTGLKCVASILAFLTMSTQGRGSSNVCLSVRPSVRLSVTVLAGATVTWRAKLRYQQKALTGRQVCTYNYTRNAVIYCKWQYTAWPPIYTLQSSWSICNIVCIQWSTVIGPCGSDMSYIQQSHCTDYITMPGASNCVNHLLPKYLIAVTITLGWVAHLTETTHVRRVQCNTSIHVHVWLCTHP